MLIWNLLEDEVVEEDAVMDQVVICGKQGQMELAGNLDSGEWIHLKVLGYCIHCSFYLYYMDTKLSNLFTTARSPSTFSQHPPLITTRHLPPISGPMELGL